MLVLIACMYQNAATSQGIMLVDALVHSGGAEMLREAKAPPQGKQEDEDCLVKNF